MKKIHLFTRLLYLLSALLSFHLLVSSRAAEIHTVWDFMNPLFTPVFFATTLVLVIIVFSSESIEYKLLFIIIYSVISCSFLSIVLPAGDASGQHLVLGVTRRIYENTTFHGWGVGAENIIVQLYKWFNRPNFQSAYSVMFARMFSVDVFWVHLLLIPLLWGFFVPMIVFMITRTLGMTERISALSSLLASAFPLLVYWGTISVPNSMGYIFFLGSLYFCLKFLSFRKSKIRYLMVLFSFASFLSHFLTGIMSFAFLLLAISLKRYEREKAESPLAAKFLLAVSFVLSASLIPLASIYNRIFSPSYAYFSLNKMQGLHATDLLGLFLFGEYLNYSLMTALIHITGPLIGLGGLLYTLYVSVKHRCNYNDRVLILFLFLGFLVAFVDYRILKLFMMNMPFNEERIWVFRDFTVLPFVAFALSGVVVFISKAISRFAFFGARARARRFVGAALNAFVLVLLAGWILASVYVAYPRYGPLQITSYELEAVKYIERTTNRSYIVVGDQWIAYAGLMFVGIYNSEAYYFSPPDPRGVTLFVAMKNNPTNETLVEAMKTTNATVAYFIIEKPRLAEEDYNHIIQQAEQNGLQTYPGGIFYHKDEEKLRIFYYQSQSATG